MDVFKEAWERQVHLLMDAVDDITTIDDFLAVSGLSLLHKCQLHSVLFLTELMYVKLLSVLCHCWLGIRKSILPVKIECLGAVVVISLE